MYKDTNYCIVCGSKRWRYHMQLGKYSVIQCELCGIGKTSPFPTGEEQAEVNRSIYTIEQRLKIYEGRSKELLNRYNNQIKQISQYHIGKQKKILDIGCNLGFFLKVAKDSGYDVYGVELAEEPACYARDKLGLNVFWGILEEACYPDNFFDVITLWDVLEHVPDPKSLLLESKRILKEGGVLIIQSPNMDSTMARVTQEHWSWWIPPDHLYHFTPQSLEQLVKSTNFQLLDICTWDPPRDFYINILNAKLNLRATDRRFIDKVLQKIIGWSSIIARPLIIVYQKKFRKSGLGGLVTIYARKEPNSRSVL